MPRTIGLHPLRRLRRSASHILYAAVCITLQHVAAVTCLMEPGSVSGFGATLGSVVGLVCHLWLVCSTFVLVCFCSGFMLSLSLCVYTSDVTCVGEKTTN